MNESLLLLILFLCSSVKLPTQNVELPSVSGIFLILAGKHFSSCCIFGISNPKFLFGFLVFWWSRVRFRGVRFQLFLWFACLVLSFVLEWNLDGAGWRVVFTSLVLIFSFAISCQFFSNFFYRATLNWLHGCLHQLGGQQTFVLQDCSSILLMTNTGTFPGAM